MSSAPFTIKMRQSNWIYHSVNSTSSSSCTAAPRPPPGIDNIIIIDNVPCIPESKVEKLKNVIKKVLSAVGTVVTIELPMNDATGKTTGFCFVEFATKDMAFEAKTSCDGYKLDKKHGAYLINPFQL